MKSNKRPGMSGKCRERATSGGSGHEFVAVEGEMGRGGCKGPRSLDLAQRSSGKLGEVTHELCTRCLCSLGSRGKKIDKNHCFYIFVSGKP